MSNLSLPARETDPPFSHKSGVSITHEQNICRSRGERSANEKEGKNPSKDSNQLLDEIEQNIVICRRANQLFADAESRAIDKSQYFARTQFNNCFIIHLSSFVLYLSVLIFRKFSKASRHCLQANAHAQSIICS